MEFSTQYRTWYLLFAIFFTLLFPVSLLILVIVGISQDIDDLIPLYFFLTFFTIAVCTTFITNFKKVILTKEHVLIKYLILKKDLTISYTNIEGYHAGSRSVTLVLNTKKEIHFPWMISNNMDDFLNEIEKRGIKKIK